MGVQKNYLSDYEKIIKLIADHVDLNPDYALELLEASFRQILLKKTRAIRDASMDDHKRIQYGTKACFYSEGDQEDMRILAEAYLQTKETALSHAIKNIRSQQTVNYKPRDKEIEKICKEREINQFENTKVMKREDFKTDLGVGTITKNWKKEDIRDTPDMPEEERSLLLKHLKNVKCFLEYGSGGSTVLASSLNIPYIYSVDSDKLFLDAVIEKVKELNTSGNLTSCWIDVGPVEHYGNPVDFSKAVKWPNYCVEPWKKILTDNQFPELILIDGRFRVSSFLASIAFAKSGTIILFDDYTERENYHSVEKFLKPTRIAGRMAEFIINEPMISKELIIELIPSVCLHG